MRAHGPSPGLRLGLNCGGWMVMRAIGIHSAATAAACYISHPIIASPGGATDVPSKSSWRKADPETVRNHGSSTSMRMEEVHAQHFLDGCPHTSTTRHPLCDSSMGALVPFALSGMSLYYHQRLYRGVPGACCARDRFRLSAPKDTLPIVDTRETFCETRWTVYIERLMRCQRIHM